MLASWRIAFQQVGERVLDTLTAANAERGGFRKPPLPGDFFLRVPRDAYQIGKNTSRLTRTTP